MDLKGKKLLILGATAYITNMVEIAKSKGVYTIVTDPDPDSPAKKVADKSYNIDTTDIEGIIAIALENKVDGITTGYSDVNMPICYKVCKRLNLPFYASLENIERTSDKSKFKQLCREYGVPVVDEYSLENINNIKYPVIVKPTDSYSSKGITVCNNQEELVKGIEKAKSFSKTNNFIIERYMTCKDVNIDYLIQDGKVMLSAVGDRYVNTEQEGLSPLSAAVIYPSNYLDKYVKELDGKVRKMFEDIGIKDGVVFIQSFLDDEGFHFFEMGYRTGGGQSSVMISKINGIDYVELLINHALTGKMSENDLSLLNNPYFNVSACGLVLLLKSGTIAEIKGFCELRNIPEIVNITQFYKVGDTVMPQVLGTLGQSLCRIHIIANNREQLASVIAKVQNTIEVIDVEGNNMLLNGFDTSMLFNS